MNANDLWAIIAILVCTLFNFFFSLAETALVSVRSSRLEPVYPSAASEHASEQSVRAIKMLLGEPTRVVAAVQLGLTVLSLAAAAIAVSVLGPDVASLLAKWDIPHPTRTAVVILVILVAGLTLILGEIIPRSIALRQPEKVALMAAVPLRWIERVERPAVAFILLISNLIVRPFGLKASFAAPVFTEEDLKTLLEASQREGVIEQDEKEMLRNIITFGDTVVHEVMTPRIDVKAADVNLSVRKLINLIVDCGHSRIPLFEESVDTIIGIIHAKDLLPAVATGDQSAPLRTMMRAVTYIPENKRVDELLDEFRRSNSQLAIVQDEYGGTAGLVTLEDLLEEIVGEIQDEYDEVQPSIIPQEDGSSIIDARLNIEDVNEALSITIPDDDFDTVGGFVFGLFGRMPQQGDEITYEDLDFQIAEADGRRVYKIRIAKAGEDEVDATPAPEPTSTVDSGTESRG